MGAALKKFRIAITPSFNAIVIKNGVPV